MRTEAGSIRLSPGLREGVSEDLEALLQLWEEMFAVSVEVAQAPEMDSNLFTFAETCLFFAVIMSGVEAKEGALKQSKDGRFTVYSTDDADKRRCDWGKDDVAVHQADNGAVEAANESKSEVKMEVRNDVDDSPVWDIFKDDLGGDSERLGAPPLPEASSSQQFPSDRSSHSTKVVDTKPFLNATDTLLGVPTGCEENASDDTMSTPWHTQETSEAGVGYDYAPYFHTYDPDPTVVSRPSGTSVVGFVYCTASPHINGPAGEVNIGIILRDQFRGKGYARQAVELTLKWVFEDLHFHRVQAALMDTLDKDKAFALFTQLGFGHEGTRRRAVFSTSDGAWKDITYLAMLDTEWVMRGLFKPAPKSLWDELFARHERERRVLMEWEDTRARLKRTMSMETVRIDGSGSKAGSKKSKLSSGGELACGIQPYEGKGKARFRTPSETGTSPPTSDSDDSTGYFTDDEPRMAGVSLASLLRKPAHVSASSRFSSSSGSLSPTENASTGSPGSSQWELLETSSTPSSSTFETLHGSDLDG